MDSNFWYRGTKAVDFRSIPGIARASAGSAQPIRQAAGDQTLATRLRPLEL
jgi:hypothetical protein